MPNINTMSESKYLKQSDLDGEVIVTVVKVGQRNIAKEGDPAQLKWLIRFEEFQKPMVLNATNRKRLAKACRSDETDDWTGKKAILYVDPDVEYAGEVVGGLRVKARPVEELKVKTSGAGDGHFDDMEDDIPF